MWHEFWPSLARGGDRSFFNSDRFVLSSFRRSMSCTSSFAAFNLTPTRSTETNKEATTCSGTSCYQFIEKRRQAHIGLAVPAARNVRTILSVTSSMNISRKLTTDMGKPVESVARKSGHIVHECWPMAGAHLAARRSEVKVTRSPSCGAFAQAPIPAAAPAGAAH